MHYAIFQDVDESIIRLATIKESRELADEWVSNHEFHHRDFNIVMFASIEELTKLLFVQDD